MDKEDLRVAKIKFERHLQRNFGALGILNGQVRADQLPGIRSFVEQALLDCYSGDAPQALVRFFNHPEDPRVEVQLWYQPVPVGIVVSVNRQAWPVSGCRREASKSIGSVSETSPSIYPIPRGSIPWTSRLSIVGTSVRASPLWLGWWRAIDRPRASRGRSRATS